MRITIELCRKGLQKYSGSGAAAPPPEPGQRVLILAESEAKRYKTTEMPRPRHPARYALLSLPHESVFPPSRFIQVDPSVVTVFPDEGMLV